MKFYNHFYWSANDLRQHCIKLLLKNKTNTCEYNEIFYFEIFREKRKKKYIYNTIMKQHLYK